MEYRTLRHICSLFFKKPLFVDGDWLVVIRENLLLLETKTVSIDIIFGLIQYDKG